MRAVAEKQRVFKGIEGVNLTTDKGESHKNATSGARALLSQGGLMVGKNWRVYCCDSLNVCVSRRSKSKSPDSKEKWVIEGYFSTVAGALHFLVEKSIKETELADLKVIVDKVEELKHDILKLFA